MTRPASFERIEKELRFLKVYAALSSLALVVLLVSAFALAAPERVQVLDVERLNVLNEDGSPALVLAGRGGLPGPTFDGREYPQELSGGRVTASGMIFFNERGDEVGGLTYHGQLVEGGGYLASGGIMFDQFRQDQTVGIQYQDNGESRSAGLSVWDRSPDVSIGDLLELVDARLSASGAVLDSIEAEIAEFRGVASAHRIFLGSRDRDAHLLIRDTAGRPRIRLSVDREDVARLEFLDAAGNVTAAFPQ
jgi:hypothetical protein